MIEYVAGFLFSEDYLWVSLIEKQRPQWQKGKLNAIGGKIEPNETPEDAMRREFIEETGLDVADWKRFCVLRGESDVNWRVYFFYAIGKVDRVKQMTDERPIIFFVNGIGAGTLPNLSWLVPMALNSAKNLENCSNFQVVESYG